MTSAVNTDLLSSLGLLQNSSPSASGSSTSTNQLGQQDFLKLMTTQLSNQDPFKPMDSGAFLSQMAEFSTVSGIGDLQTSFQQLAASLTSNQGLQASSLVGHAVAVPSTQGVLPDQGGMGAAVDVPTDATDVVVDIVDQSGQVVKHMDLGPQGTGLTQLSWDGVTTAGSRAAAGTYGINATAVIGNQTEALNVYAVDTVDSVTLNGNGSAPQLNLGTLGTVDFSKVKQIM
jgi:flagellar basal-body rod modification protein FlgD